MLRSNKRTRKKDIRNNKHDRKTKILAIKSSLAITSQQTCKRDILPTVSQQNRSHDTDVSWYPKRLIEGLTRVAFLNYLTFEKQS